MTDIYVAGVGMTKLGRLLDMSYKDMVREAVTAALNDSGAAFIDIEQAFSSSSTLGFLQDQTFVGGEIALREMGFSDIPMFNLENACASGSSAFHLAVNMLKAGACDIAMAVGFEKMNIDDKARMFSVFDSGWDVQNVETTKEGLLALGEGLEIPDGTTSERPYSVFMDVYAAFCRQHMKKFGTTQRQIAAVAAKNHQHSVHNELSQFRDAYSIDEVLVDITTDLFFPPYCLLLASVMIVLTPSINTLIATICTTLSPPIFLTRKNSIHQVAISASATSLFFKWTHVVLTRVPKLFNFDTNIECASTTPA